MIDNDTLNCGNCDRDYKRLWDMEKEQVSNGFFKFYCVDCSEEVAELSYPTD